MLGLAAIDDNEAIRVEPGATFELGLKIETFFYAFVQ
jgi:hypothetical protein